MSVTSIRLQEELEKPLLELADKQRRSKNWLINQAIKEYLENHEFEEERWLETLPAIESVKNGQSIPSESVESWLKSWGTTDEISAPKK
jgi:predicted transcriptional regulator